MPFLMVNLDDPADCRRGLKHLESLVPPGPRGRRGPGGCGGPPPRAAGLRHNGPGRPAGPPPPPEGDLRDLPMMQKLRRIRQRGVWKYLQMVATQVQQPLSLPELDNVLGLEKNKMKSLKAIMGKLERRWGLEFLVPDPNGGVDAAGNPRYVMPPPLRNKIVKLSA